LGILRNSSQAFSSSMGMTIKERSSK